MNKLSEWRPPSVVNDGILAWQEMLSQRLLSAHWAIWKKQPPPDRQRDRQTDHTHTHTHTHTTLLHWAGSLLWLKLKSALSRLFTLLSFFLSNYLFSSFCLSVCLLSSFCLRFLSVALILQPKTCSPKVQIAMGFGRMNLMKPKYQ